MMRPGVNWGVIPYFFCLFVVGSTMWNSVIPDQFIILLVPHLHELFTSQCNYSWAAKIFNLISIVFPDVAVNPHNLFRPGIPIRVKDFYNKRYDESWLLSINKNYDPNSQNKLKMYASIKNVFAVENYVLALPMMKRRHFTKPRISSHRLAIETTWRRYTRPITPKNERSVYLPGWPGHTSAKWSLRTRVGHMVYPGTEQHFHSSVHGWAHPGTEAGCVCDVICSVI